MKKFILRAYGLWIQDNRILISHETLNDFSFTKFPGGGVEHGEGIKDALLREMLEETGVKLQPDEVSHFYTTEFFQQSAFNPNDQIVSVYFRIQSKQQPLFHQKDESTSLKIHHLRTEWIPLNDLKPKVLTFPIDKHVLEMLTNNET
jgi:8-oxo-dGTP diphosphatase